MKFENAIKVNGKATLGDGGYVMFDDEDKLVNDNGTEQIFNKCYLTGTDWEPYYKDTSLSSCSDPAHVFMDDLEVIPFNDVKKALKDLRKRMRHKEYPLIEERSVNIINDAWIIELINVMGSELSK